MAIHTNNIPEILDILTTHRRALHLIPEIDIYLPKTRDYIMNIIGKMNCEITTVVHTGLCAFFDKGKPSTVAFRSDMDALKVTEANTHDFVSTHPGQMHACGHDGHMSILLAFAEYVNCTEDFPHNILLIFQPAEETTGGAKEIAESGIFEKYHVIRTFGIHLWPPLAKGQLSTKPGALMAKSSELTIEIEGKSAHAATAHEGIDALYIAAQYLLDIYKMQVTEIPVEEKTLLKLCKMTSGTVRNAIAAQASLLGTMRAFNMHTFDFMAKRLNEIANAYEKEYGCKIDVDITEGYLPVINDAELYQTIQPYLEQLENYQELSEPVMISEDFSFYGTKAPSVFMFLGTGRDLALHSDHFDFDEEILLAGYQFYQTVASIQ
ncbi:M20 metallopeptidase family protein [Clostridium aminobutyricum]|uniref:Amidohydrolase n=1 Tax=Clostridium aminobutyricum TaxID=33953 RepID=A0A939D916_CLOAM|nr:amidohydrolase [Clostridium aminobutyricum]MBN7773644.1 amidohydrolase [Clostridium aminobutyricum]